MVPYKYAISDNIFRLRKHISIMATNSPKEVNNGGIYVR